MDWLFDINFWGVVHGTRAFLPHLKTMGEAHIVNLSSIFGIIAPPGQSAYAAAKFAVRGFSESVRHELAMAGSPVRLSVVHPGGVATAIARNSRTGVGVTDNARRVAIDRAVRECGQDHAERRRAAHHQGHREKRAAHPDRQRRPLHGPAAALPPGNVLGAVAAQAGEDGEGDRAEARCAPSSWRVFTNLSAVIPREGGESSTPRPIDSTTAVSEYWIARLRGR